MSNGYYISFLGSTRPILRNKIKNPSERHLIRLGLELVNNMAGTLYIYYVSKLPAPLTKVNMEVSLFISKLTRKFKSHAGAKDNNEVWVYYGDK